MSAAQASAKYWVRWDDRSRHESFRRGFLLIIRSNTGGRGFQSRPVLSVLLTRTAEDFIGTGM